MKKILFASGHSRMSYKWGMVGEVVKRLMEDPENEIYYLDCNGAVKGPCGLNHKKHWFYCNKCSKPCLKVLAQADFPQDKILKMQKYEIPEFPDFKTIDEIRDYNYEDYNLGLGPLSCIMTVSRDYNFNIKKWQKHIKRFFGTEYVILKNIEHYHSIYNFDEIHTFNGRMASMYPYVSFAKAKKIPYTVYEGGAKIDRLLILHNSVPHEVETIRENIKKLWDKSGEDRIEIANKFFFHRLTTFRRYLSRKFIHGRLLRHPMYSSLQTAVSHPPAAQWRPDTGQSRSLKTSQVCRPLPRYPYPYRS